MKTTILSLLLIVAWGSVKAQCAQQSNIYQFTYGTHVYLLVREANTWTSAAACAASYGAYLAEINDANEQAAIFNELTNNASIVVGNTVAPDGGGASYVWIGGNDIAAEGTWIWDGDDDGIGPQFWQGTTTGNPVGGLYNNWGNEPDNYGTGQDGLGLALTNWPLGVAGQWNDVADNNNLYFLIEIDDLGNEELEEKSLNIYPNPVDGILNIDNSNSEALALSLKDLSGKVLNEHVIGAGQSVTIDLSIYTPGIYLLEGDDRIYRIVVE